ncbi:MAG: hypothetical protein ABJZ55_04395 [Fuerstiella sp.]
MSDLNVESPVEIAQATIGLRHTIILGTFIVVAAVLHARLHSQPDPDSQPRYEGIVVGQILVKEQSSVAHHKCNGFKIECYDAFVIVHVDKTKEPSWTGDYVLTFPWSKIEHLVMSNPEPQS